MDLKTGLEMNSEADSLMNLKEFIREVGRW
jgi:hypothetical protein